MDFLKSCPRCHGRFHVKLQSKRLAHLERQPVQTRTIVNPRRPGSYLAVSRLVQGTPMIIDTAEFQDSYKCEHCGHEWSEKHIEKDREA